MSHTPGPWKSVFDDETEDWRIVANGWQVADGITGDPKNNDARLIAAAPDLLEACEQVKLWADEADPYEAADVLPLIEAAIAKATSPEERT